jgi:chromosome segregation ATPase
MEGFLDTDVDMATGKITMGSSKASLIQAPMSSEGQGLLGILKQMRGQEIAELQGRQEIEQATAAKFAVYVQQTNTKIEFLQNEQAKLEEQLASRKSSLSENTERQSAARTELAETEKLLEETIAASKALAKAHADLTEIHTSEMNGLAKAIEILSGQQTIHKGMFLQTAGSTVQKNVHIEDMFYKINVAIQKKIKALNVQLTGLKDQEEQCKEELATIAAVGASQEAMQNTLKTKIAATQSEINTLTTERDDLSKKVGQTEAAIAAGQATFEDGDKARAKELDELVESKKAIAAALQALHDAGSENSSFGQAIEILKMIASECDTGIKEVTAAKADEMKEWGEQKTSHLNLIREMETQIQTLDHDLSRNNAKKTKQEATLKHSEEQGKPDPAECEAFLADYSAEVKEREDKITQLKDASSALANWENFAAAGGAGSSATLGAMKTAEDIEAGMGF